MPTGIRPIAKDRKNKAEHVFGICKAPRCKNPIGSPDDDGFCQKCWWENEQKIERLLRQKNRTEALEPESKVAKPRVRQQEKPKEQHWTEVEELLPPLRKERIPLLNTLLDCIRRKACSNEEVRQYFVKNGYAEISGAEVFSLLGELRARNQVYKSDTDKLWHGVPGLTGRVAEISWMPARPEPPKQKLHNPPTEERRKPVDPGRTPYAEKPPAWRYANRDDIDIHGQGKPRWIWLETAIAGMPPGKAIVIDIPPNEEPTRFHSLLSSALRSSKRCGDWRLSIRRSRDLKSLVIVKNSLWASSVRRMEGIGQATMMIDPRPN